MTSNYEWNKRQVEERLAARYRDAEEHRLAGEATAGAPTRTGWWTRLRTWLSRRPGDMPQRPLRSGETEIRAG